MRNLISQNAPLRHVQQPSSSVPVWYSRPLKKILKDKRKYHKLWKLFGNLLDYQSFIILRKRTKKLESTCYNNYISFSENKIKIYPNFFRTYVKAIFSTNKLPQSMTCKDISSSNGQQICNLFNMHLHSLSSSSLVEALMTT